VWLFGAVTKSIVFLISFICIRCYAGGYHAGTRGKCFILSTAFTAVIIAFLKWIRIPIVIGIIILCFSAAVILVLAPCPSKNKPLNNKEKSIYRRITRYVLFAEILVCWLLPVNLSDPIIMAICSSAMLLLITYKEC